MQSYNKVLVIDDDEFARIALHELLLENSFECDSFNDPIEALNQVTNSNIYSAIISDVRMKNLNGIELLKEVKKVNSEIPVILITGYEDIKIVIEALRIGAYDFLQKPFDNDYLIAILTRAIEQYNLTIQNKNLKKNIVEKENYIKSLEKTLEEIKATNASYDLLIGNSPAIKKVFEIIKIASSTEANVLITGESGTGKELVAMAIHNSSLRKDNKFMPVNCAAIPENLLESELFGYEAGAFTGATRRKIGKFEFADGGTLFLDEIGDLSPNLQVKLLRVLQDKSITRLGSNQSIFFNVRIITATNKDLIKLIAEGSFREDIYYRLNIINIHIPPLRERKEDILLLTMYFINRFNLLYNKKIKNVSQNFYNFLINNYWKGNVRELENTLERMVIVSNDEILEVPNDISFFNPNIGETIHPENSSLRESLNFYEKNLIINCLDKNKGNVLKTSTDLKIGLKTLYRKIKEYNITH